MAEGTALALPIPCGAALDLCSCFACHGMLAAGGACLG